VLYRYLQPLRYLVAFLTPGEETDSSKAATHEDRIVKIAIVGASVRAGSPIAAELARPRRRGLGGTGPVPLTADKPGYARFWGRSRFQTA